MNPPTNTGELVCKAACVIGLTAGLAVVIKAAWSLVLSVWTGVKVVAPIESELFISLLAIGLFILGAAIEAWYKVNQSKVN